jgi:dipeptidyl aminopeptidase/acylaminoacyl peptidase
MPKSSYHLTAAEIHPRQGLSGFQLSPDGLWLSFLLQRDLRSVQVEEEGGQRVKTTPVADLCLMPSGGGYPRVLTSAGDVSSPGAWSRDGKSLVFGRSDELQLLELADVAPTGPSVAGFSPVYKGRLYKPDVAAGDAYLAYPCWRPPGEDLLLFATCDGKKTSLRVVSRDGRLRRDLYSVNGAIIGWQWSPDGQKILFVARDENRLEGFIGLLDFDSAALVGSWPERYYEYNLPAAVWTPDGGHIVFRSNRSGWSKLWVAAPDGSDARPLTEGDWDEYSFRFSPDGWDVAYASRCGQSVSGDDLWAVSLGGGEPRRITHHPGVNVPVAWSEDGRLYYLHSSPSEPQELWLANLGGGEERTRRLTFSAPAELERKLRAPEEVIIENADAKIPALIYLPADHEEGDSHPAIVWVRGGPTGSCRYDFNPICNYLANLGFVVITPNYRGSTGCGIGHMESVLGEGVGRNDLNDIWATQKYIRERLPHVNLERGIGIGGRSWGGYLTLMAVTSDEAPPAFSCAVAGAAISDWFVQQAETEVRYYDCWLVGGWVYEQQEWARARSPVNFIKNIRVPLLVYHGEFDRDVPFSQIKIFVQKAEGAGVRIDHKFYPGEGHSFKKPENQEDVLSLTGDFFRKHLQPWNLSDNPCADQVL